jgi:hypothetical protein
MSEQGAFSPIASPLVYVCLRFASDRFSNFILSPHSNLEVIDDAGILRGYT